MLQIYMKAYRLGEENFFILLGELLWRFFSRQIFQVVKSPKKALKRLKKGPNKAKNEPPKVNGLDWLPPPPRLMD